MTILVVGVGATGGYFGHGWRRPAGMSPSWFACNAFTR
jgi:hypothetical protein